MKTFVKNSALFGAMLALSACAFTPEQLAAREAQRIRAEQALQINLAKQCDAETAELMAEHFDPPIARTAAQEKAFNARYAEKVGDPMFQACYKIALENYKLQQQMQEMRYQYDDWRFGRGRFFCYACW